MKHIGYQFMMYSSARKKYRKRPIEIYKTSAYVAANKFVKLVAGTSVSIVHLGLRTYNRKNNVSGSAALVSNEMLGFISMGAPYKFMMKKIYVGDENVRRDSKRNSGRDTAASRRGKSNSQRSAESEWDEEGGE